MSSGPMNAIVVGELSPETISVTWRSGSLSVGAALAVIARKRQTARIRNSFVILFAPPESDIITALNKLANVFSALLAIGQLCYSFFLTEVAIGCRPCTKNEYPSRILVARFLAAFCISR